MRNTDMASTVPRLTTTSNITTTITAILEIVTSPPTLTCPPVPITFNLQLPQLDLPLYEMQNHTIVKIIGEQTSLGVWKPENAAPLSKGASAAWSLTLDFVPGVKVVYNL